jgi:hypothetical protein
MIRAVVEYLKLAQRASFGRDALELNGVREQAQADAT